jgi:hypothetical protein
MLLLPLAVKVKAKVQLPKRKRHQNKQRRLRSPQLHSTVANTVWLAVGKRLMLAALNVALARKLSNWSTRMALMPTAQSRNELNLAMKSLACNIANPVLGTKWEIVPRSVMVAR